MNRDLVQYQRDTRGTEERRMNRELVVPAGIQEGRKKEE